MHTAFNGCGPYVKPVLWGVFLDNRHADIV